MPYYNEENLDEPDPVCENDDAKTIQMDSPEFWKACETFRINESNARQSENGFDSNPLIVESDTLTYKAFESLQASHKMRYFDILRAASTSWAAFEKSCPRLDKFVFQHYDNNNYLSWDGLSLSLQDNVKQRWSLSEAPSPVSASTHEDGNTGSLVHWYDDDLRWDSANMRDELKPYRSPPPPFIFR
ncbi:hypothetical protein N7478_010070 [Penicillium angulare]|uniref:uncharacterized protein n=1 Tax=Penicillium angulare TaxID=116970 RepID=UPI002542474E|nr:uncharacterized protein N7478_010070 [Penicillium angulare]KAJ5267262.1 hypothetical protein N7478_010070 [Penicillium angulare]